MLAAALPLLRRTSARAGAAVVAVVITAISRAAALRYGVGGRRCVLRRLLGGGGGDLRRLFLSPRWRQRVLYSSGPCAYRRCKEDPPAKPGAVPQARSGARASRASASAPRRRRVQAAAVLEKVPFPLALAKRFPEKSGRRPGRLRGREGVLRDGKVAGECSLQRRRRALDLETPGGCFRDFRSGRAAAQRGGHVASTSPLLHLSGCAVGDKWRVNPI